MSRRFQVDGTSGFDGACRGAQRRFIEGGAVERRVEKLAAPREAASRPRAPVPANASTQCQPGNSPPPAPAMLASQLNSVSRTRSGVGRRPGLSATERRVRFHWPPMMRTSLGRDFDREGDGDDGEAGRLAAAAFFWGMRQA
jgi:hypothetical protein